MEHAADMSREASRDLFIVLIEAELAGKQKILFILTMPIRGRTDEKTEIQPDKYHPISVVDWEMFHKLFCADI